MKTVHLPRRLAVVLLILLAAAFLSGNVLAFRHTASLAALAPTITGSPLPSLSPTATPTPIPPSADTTGILILGILLVSIILIGLLWGSRLKRK
jgi:hypothetical protein